MIDRSFAAEAFLKKDILFEINENIILQENEIASNIFSLNGQIEVNGIVEGSVFSIGKPVYIKGLVEENVIVLAGDIVLLENSSVRGNAIAINGDVLQSYGSMVWGGIKEVKIIPDLSKFPLFKNVNKFSWHPFYYLELPILSLVFQFITKLFLAIFFVLLMPNKIMYYARSVQERPWKNLFLGIIVLFSMPILIIFLGLTILGIPLIPILILLSLFIGYLGGLAIKYALGDILLNKINIKNKSPILIMFIGLLILELFMITPILRIILPVFYFLGLGTIINNLFFSKERE